MTELKPFDSPPLRWTREVVTALLILGILTAFRLWYCTYPDILDDEAYYWLWSNHLDASYYSKGPGIAWTIALGTAIFGDTAFGIRWISVVLSACTGWQLFILTRRLFNERTALTALVVASVVPLLAIGSVLMTIDPLSVFFWVWAANLFCDALARDRWRDWLLTGFAVGLGFLAKYVNAIELLCFLAFLLWSPAYRKHLLRPKFYAMLGVFLLCTVPVFWWNSHHGWITATHLKERGSLEKKFSIRPGQFFQFLYMQAVVISPLLFIGMLVSLFVTAFRKEKSDAEKLLLALSGPIFAFYAVLALNNKGQANWTATGYIGLLSLVAFDWRQRLQRSPRWCWAVGAALFLAAAESAILHETAPLNLPTKTDPLTRSRGWQSFAEHVDAARKQYQPQLLIGNRYQTAALMSWYLPDHPTTFIPNADHIQNQFSFWPGYTATPGTTALFVTDEIDTIPARLKEEFASVEKVGEFWTTFRGKNLKRYVVYLCSNQPRITAGEVEVLELILQRECGGALDRKKEVILDDLPSVDFEENTKDGLKKLVTKLQEQAKNKYPTDLFQDFYFKNSQDLKFSNSLFHKVPVQCLSHRECDSYFTGTGKVRPPGWEGFYKKHPQASGIVTLSRVAFSRDSQWALVYIAVRSNWLAGHGCFYLLHRNQDGEWELMMGAIGSMWIA